MKPKIYQNDACKVSFYDEDNTKIKTVYQPNKSVSKAIEDAKILAKSYQAKTFIVWEAAYVSEDLT